MDHGEATGEKVPAAEAAATPNAAEEALSFEEALGRLELLVRKMEEGKLSLEELTASFEEGRRLARVCRARIGRLERKIENGSVVYEWNENLNLEERAAVKLAIDVKQAKKPPQIVKLPVSLSVVGGVR